MQYLRDQETRKMAERQVRAAMKGMEIEKDHKFWNTQVCHSAGLAIIITKMVTSSL